MTDRIFFDTDCLSAFLWVGSENILIQLFKGKVVIPQQVYDEIKRVPNLCKKTDTLIQNSDVLIGGLVAGTPEAELYIKLTTKPDAGYKIIGKGEASAISLAKFNDGILGSNNLKDILPYVKLFSLKHITTGDILVEALSKGLITERQGNTMWEDMIKRKLPASTFSDFLGGKFRK